MCSLVCLLDEDSCCTAANVYTSREKLKHQIGTNWGVHTGAALVDT